MRVTVVDLNNFSRYPTMSVGYITAVLRGEGHQVTVLSPFSVGVNGFPRVTRPGRAGFVTEWMKYRTATSGSPLVRSLRGKVANALRPTNAKSRDRIVDAARQALQAPCDVLLISAYTMYFETCAEICAIAAQRRIPVIVGGPLFNHRAVADRWLRIDGLTGVFGGEPEQHISELVTRVGNGQASVEIPGFRTASSAAPPATPLTDLDAIPFADYSDFPWHRYPNRIIPMMTGRGCGWGVCTFCSDVATSSGRVFRTRSLANVLAEMRWQSERHGTRLFTFLDLKLNSDIGIWSGLAEQVQSVVPGAEWTASIHVNARDENGLSAQNLRSAHKAGLLRMTTGLESGSQRILNAMAKGTTPEMVSQTIRHAAEAGISVRLTVIAGYPGETAEDVMATRRFLDTHIDYVDRVVVNRFALQLGTPAEKSALNAERRMQTIENPTLDRDQGAYEMDNRTFSCPAHRRAMAGLILSAHRINRKPLSNISTTFEGVM